MTPLAIIFLAWMIANMIYSGGRVGWTWNEDKTEKATRSGAFLALCIYSAVAIALIVINP